MAYYVIYRTSDGRRESDSTVEPSGLPGHLDYNTYASKPDMSVKEWDRTTHDFIDRPAPRVIDTMDFMTRFTQPEIQKWLSVEHRRAVAESDMRNIVALQKYVLIYPRVHLNHAIVEDAVKSMEVGEHIIATGRAAEILA